MIVVLDNRDSFVFNLTRHFHLLGVAAVVVPSHAIDLSGLERLSPRAIVISPGPCTPAEAGCSVAAVRAFRGRVPMLGVCLGHQAIAAALGAEIIRAREPVHGRTSRVHHDGVNLFAGIPSPMAACRYHSLVVDGSTLPPGLAITARDDEGTIMALAHEADGLYGVQFHPESILTRHGFRLLANFLDRAGIQHHAAIVADLDAHVAIQSAAMPDCHDDDPRVVTF
ncbi:MAG: aminodeoxychorismate/anthranilate synthase component II [Planctomycetes bacterium]|nr:aminodeoxychorismate/anthranilate synthase component II [Planctomycetota bacterium]